MSLLLTDDHRLLIEAVRDFARAELIERDRHWDRTETSCCQELDALYQLGVMALRIPEDHGGLACPFVPYAHIIRELAACSASVADTVSVHNMVAQILNEHGADDVRDEVLPQLAEPGNLAAFAISEPNAGSDPGAARTRAQPVDGGWRLSGSKMWVTNGVSGRWFCVLARTDDSPAASPADRRSGQAGGAAQRANGPALDGPARPGDGPARELSMLLLDAHSDGVTRVPIHGKMGIRGSETAELHFDNVFIPASRLLGQRGSGMRVALSALDGGRIGIAAQAAGIAQACLELMTAYALQREQFNRPIADFQAIQWMIADSQAERMAAERLIDKAAWLADQNRPFTRAASMAKLYASEAANRIAYRAVQVHGGYGFVNEFRVEQLYRDARITSIYEGTSEIQRLVIARELLRG